MCYYSWIMYYMYVLFIRLHFGIRIYNLLFIMCCFVLYYVWFSMYYLLFLIMNYELWLRFMIVCCLCIMYYVWFIMYCLLCCFRCYKWCIVDYVLCMIGLCCDWFCIIDDVLFIIHGLYVVYAGCSHVSICYVSGVYYEIVLLLYVCITYWFSMYDLLSICYVLYIMNSVSCITYVWLCMC